jgi:hypothetical protein
MLYLLAMQGKQLMLDTVNGVVPKFTEAGYFLKLEKQENGKFYIKNFNDYYLAVNGPQQSVDGDKFFVTMYALERENGILFTLKSIDSDGEVIFNSEYGNLTYKNLMAVNGALAVLSSNINKPIVLIKSDGKDVFDVVTSISDLSLSKNHSPNTKLPGTPSRSKLPGIPSRSKLPDTKKSNNKKIVLWIGIGLLFIILIYLINNRFRIIT